MATIVVTGGSSGVGLAAAKQFAARGDEVILVGRDQRRLSAAVAEVRAITGTEPANFRTDFESLTEVRELAAALKKTVELKKTEETKKAGETGKTGESSGRIDVLVNNAGGMVGDYRRTVDGFEATMQGNHLAPFLLTTLLRDELRDARVVNTASRAHMRGVPDPANLAGDAANYRSWTAYGAGKASNVLFAAEAARRWPDILSVSFHPGVVRTNFGAGRVTRFFYRYTPFLVTPEKAGELLVWLATAPRDELVNGGYYVGREPVRPAPHARNPELAAELWKASTEAVKG
ncbi:SDR family NAD(P)-dependent oxidoreductase [Actinoplanes derwentensis]|uniref:NAD(P)-dependent dehydrogenase, short-chain alcohol dehydrogenase family n=1 Tax=Actinoplanes derwentensis TaxID=113562 RepID=A0A1H2C112_9ACTN|nr:SDR family NAD(P)-dependent oxidoreductase [Actinoplanes derwentensis]GID84646.1 hypothetical protein Ade03nite_35700 [Actinoplanes derwentensis]SDT63869.1 NAD(P)-dependent dehydrogenase, short-chain alcohol dehydrogenase family [Actinoplanes derwentensis]